MEDPDPSNCALIKALSAMVVRLGRQRQDGLTPTSGNIMRPGQRLGILPQEARVMAEVSRRLLQAGLEDTGSEIFNLLESCTRPLGSWLPDAASMGAAELVLMDAETGLATEEALELATGFSGMEAEMQQGAFLQIRAEIAKRPKLIADAEYTAMREFVIRNPVGERMQMVEAIKALMLPSSLTAILHRDIYREAPRSWSTGGGLKLCGHCGNALLRSPARTLACRSPSCHYGRPQVQGRVKQGTSFLCVSPPFQLYWVEPGSDEVILFDALKAMGKEPRLYPDQDAVDVAFGTVGIDLKNYASPVMLGRKLSQSLGGLSRYQTKWLVIPDRCVTLGDDYREQLIIALGANASRLSVLGLTEAIERARDA